MTIHANDAPISLRFCWGATTLVGLGAVAWVGALDVALNMYEEPASFGIASWLLWLALGCCAIPPLAFAVAIFVWPWRGRLSRQPFVGLLVGAALQIVALLYLSLPLALISVGPVWLCGALIANARDTRPTRSLAVAVAAAILAAGATTLLVFAHRPSPLAWGAFAATALVAGCALARVALARYPAPTPYLLGASVVVLLLSCFTVSFATANPSAPRAQPTHRAALPNVVLIVLDTTRRDHLGVYGHAGHLTPNLDRIAADATVYDDAISAADWTAPSHASLFTGWYPVTHGVSFAHHRWLDDHFQTLAEMLGGEGFQTVGLAANRILQLTNLQQGFDHYVLTWNDGGSYLGSAAQIIGFPDRWVDKGARRSIDELNRWIDDSYDPSRPLFLFVNLLETHWRYLPPAAQRSHALPTDVPYWQATRISAGFYPIQWLGGQPHSRDGERAIRALYAAEVAYQDQQLGRFMEALRQRIDLDHTLLIITADHGENLGEGGRWDHTFAVNDQLVHVPLIIRFPGGAHAGRHIRGQCQNIDLLPTIFAVLERSVPIPGLPGRTLVPDQFSPRAVTFSESVPFFDHAERLTHMAGMQRDIARFTHVLQAARRENFKLVVADDGSEVLYDLAADPDETTDVAPAHPQMVQTLRAELHAWQRDSPRYAATNTGETSVGKPPAAGLTDAERERLRQLGYMQ